MRPALCFIHTFLIMKIGAVFSDCPWRSVRKFAFIPVLALFYLPGFAQIEIINSPLPRSVSAIIGDYYLDHDRLEDAIYYYQRSIEENPNHVLAMLRLAEAFAQKGESIQVTSWHDKALSIDPDIEASYILKYVFAFNANKNYEDAINWANIYKEKLAADPSGGRPNDTTLFILKDLTSVNSGHSESGALQYKDRLIFSSDRMSNGTKIYETVLSPEDREANVQPLHADINALITDAQIAIAAQAGMLFFIGKNPKNQDESKIYYCDIPENPRDKIRIRSISFKDFDQSMIHPTANSDGTILYFSSENKANGFDIYKTEGKGSNWSTPKLLGQNINTKGDEMYPFLHKDRTLYFASNGHDGLGGFDIFKVNLEDQDAQAENLGPFINSPSDEFSFTIDEKEEVGFLSSNRGGEEQDIYQLHILNLPFGAKPANAISSANLSIYSSGGDEIRMTGKKAENFRFSLTAASNYDLFINKHSYRDNDVKSKARPEPMKLQVGTEYNFIIEKYGGSRVGQGGIDRGEVLRNLHANPGDLVTFQFAPDGDPNPRQYESWNETKIAFKYQDEKVSNEDTLALGYVVEEMPSSGTDEGNVPLAREVAGDEEPLAAKNMEAGEDEMAEEALAVKEKMNDGPAVNSPDSVKTVALAKEEQVSANAHPDHEVEEKRASDEGDEEELQGVSDEKNMDVAVVHDVAEESSLVAANVALPESLENGSDNDDQQENQNDLPTTPEIETTDQDDPLQDNLSEMQADQHNEKTVRYRVQIAASRVELSESKLNSIYHGDLEIRRFEEDDYFKYYIGEEPSFASAKQIRNESRVDDAFIVKKIYEGTSATLDEEHSHSNIVPGGNADLDAPGENENTDIGNIINSKEELALRTGGNEISPRDRHSPAARDAAIAEGTPAEDESDGIRYRVQIAASQKALSEDALDKIYSGEREITSFEEEHFYKYVIAEEPNYFAARKIMHESGVDQAFVAAYWGGTKLKLDEAIYAQYKRAMINSGLEVPGKILDIIVVNFDFDEFVLLPEETPKLKEKVTDRLLANNSLYVVVNGHTDVQGSDSYNFGLSEERAMYVRKLIISEGIESKRVETHYFGESRLAKSCDEDDDCDESVHHANRRVEVILLEP